MKNLLTIGFASLFLLSACGASTAEKSSDRMEKEEVVVEEINYTTGTYEIDTEASNLFWEGFKTASSHSGVVSLKSGELVVENGVPSKGSFTIDMNSITCTDLEGGSATSLENHLKADDFFGVSTYPEARFEISQVAQYDGSDKFTHQIMGDLSIKDTTQEVIIFATIEESADGILKASGEAEINRTDFGITYSSGSFFENLGDKLIKDTFTIGIDLIAKQNAQ